MTDSVRHRSSTIKPAPVRPSSPTTTGGFRAHLAHLLPRHAAFTVVLTIHQLHNVPLVHGEFGLKWKIKGVTSHSGKGIGILDKVKARKAKTNLYHRSRSDTSPSASTPKGSDTDNASLFDASASDVHSVANSSTNSNDHAGATRTHPVSVSIPTLVVSANHASPPFVTRSVSTTSSIASIGSTSSSACNTPFVHNPPGFLSADWSRQGPAQNSISHDADSELLPLNGSNPPKHYYSPAKGSTPFVKLKEHTVVWEKTLRLVVQMSVGRDNGELGDCLAKFVVMQRVVAGDPDAPRNPCLGVVYLNLAQYVNAGAVTRRYLLRQSKTNATLKLTIHLEHTAGELSYVAPPLPKDEILSGVAGFLESSDVYRTRPRASDLYTHASSDSSPDDDGGSDASSVVSGFGTSDGGPGQAHGHADSNQRHATVKKPRRPFEVAKLPTINDPRGTEKLIEALFNPVPVTQPNQVTPFTYLVDLDEEGDGDGDGERDTEHGSYRADHDGAHEGQRDAVDGDGGSLYAGSQDEGVKSDYHSLRSQPSVQGSLRSKRSIRSLASKVMLRRDDVSEGPAVSTGVHPHGGATERRTWWQKVLSPPSAGGG